MKTLDLLPELQPLVGEASEKLDNIAKCLIDQYGLGESEEKKDILAFLGRTFSEHLYKIACKGGNQ